MTGLSFDWEAAARRPVLAVTGCNQRRMNDGSLAWDALALVLGDDAITLTASQDSDEIVLAHTSEPRDASWNAVPALADLVGKPLGWCWLGRNSRGYQDTFTIALGEAVPDALQPRIAFLAEGSSLSCFDLAPR